MNYPKNIVDEETKISYTLHGEYYLPDLSLPDMEKPDTENPYPGKYALAKYRFLRDHRKPLLRMLQSRFKLYSYLRQVEAECEDAYDRIEKELVQSEGVAKGVFETLHVKNISIDEIFEPDTERQLVAINNIDISSVRILCRINFRFRSSCFLLAFGFLWVIGGVPDCGIILLALVTVRRIGRLSAPSESKSKDYD